VAQADLDSTRRIGEAPVRITTGDTAPSVGPPGALVTAVDKAIRFSGDRGIVAVVGPGGSREALQTAPIYRDAELPNVVPTATSRLLRTTGAWTFRLAADDSAQGEFIGGFVAGRLGSRAALLFYIPDEYGLGLASGIGAALGRRGVRLLDSLPVRSGQVCRSGANPYEDVVHAALRAGTPDAVVLATRSPESACLLRAIVARLPHARFVAGDGTLVDSAFIARSGRTADSLYVVTFWQPGPGDTASQSFAARFRNATGRPPRHDDAMFYDAVMLLGRAIRAAGPRRVAIRRYLEELGRSHPPYPGITGPIAFRPESRRPLLMTRVSGHRLQVVPP
jgi:branched-chain amino acid transport system substrate-binding protein